MSYLRWLALLEVVAMLVGLFWSLWILMMNTGETPDSKLAKYLKDSSSLGTTLAITFIIPFLLSALHVVWSFFNLKEAGERESLLTEASTT